MKLNFCYSIQFVLIFVLVKGQKQKLVRAKPNAFLEAQKSIQNFLAYNMLNYVHVSSLVDSLQSAFFSKLEKETIIAIENDLKPNISSDCLLSLKEFVKGLKETRIWALEMVDSFGKIPSGILEGTVNAFGDYDQCVGTNVPGKFKGRYCRVAVKTPSKKTQQSKHQSSEFTPIDLSFAYKRNSSKTLVEMAAEGGTGGLEYFPIVTAICVPSTCNAEEIGYLISLGTKQTQEVMNVTVQHCLLKNEFHLTFAHKVILTAMIALILLEVFATMIDFRISSLHPDEEYRSTLKLSTQCLLSFSFRTNAIRLFKRDDNPDSIKIFHGLKVITMIWIILGHTILYNIHALSRLVHGVKLVGGFFFQIAVNPFPAPDTFFFMSGFLVIYSYMKLNMPKMGFAYFAIYRYWRLVPPIMFIVGALLLSINLNHGPMFKEYINDGLIDQCETLWWMNVLCINNFRGVDGQCMPWTWYIAVDLQLYLLSYFLLLILRKNPKRVLFITKTVIVASVFYLMGFYIYYDLPPQPFLIYTTPEASRYYTKIAHFRPDSHVMSYCIGFLMGYYVSIQKKISLTKSLKVIGWMMSFIFGTAVVFGTYLWNSGRVATMLESALYGGFYKLLWGLMISWITYMCINEKGGIVKSFLSWQGFVPLARLTYMAYLLHPIIIMISFARLRHTFGSDEMILAYAFFAFTFVSYFLGFIFCMVCEAPFTGLLSVLISSKIGKNANTANGIKKRKESFQV